MASFDRFTYHEQLEIENTQKIRLLLLIYHHILRTFSAAANCQLLRKPGYHIPMILRCFLRS